MAKREILSVDISRVEADLSAAEQRVAAAQAALDDARRAFDQAEAEYEQLRYVFDRVNYYVVNHDSVDDREDDHFDAEPGEHHRAAGPLAGLSGPDAVRAFASRNPGKRGKLMDLHDEMRRLGYTGTYNAVAVAFQTMAKRGEAVTKLDGRGYYQLVKNNHDAGTGPNGANELMSPAKISSEDDSLTSSDAEPAEGERTDDPS